MGRCRRAFARITFTICVFAPAAMLRADWPMAGANPQRTGWVPEQVPPADYLAVSRNGWLQPQWYRPIEPYIPGRVQIIAANDLLYVSTARGLYAFHEDGSLAWVYPTEMPLGHSPTVDRRTVYVGCLDGRIHAVDALTGKSLGTSPAAGAGFQTNPLVVEGVVYAGNRDGYFYAWRPGATRWEWQFPPAAQPPLAGPILYSAAYHEGDQTIYFAANDGYAYALFKDGALRWRSAKLPGEGFHSWWPVVHGDAVIFSGNHRFRSFTPPSPPGGDLHDLQRDYIFPKGLPKGTVRSPQAPDGWLDTSRPVVTTAGTIRSNSDYFEDKPHHRTYFVLNRASGSEFTYDFDGDGRPEYAPMLWFGTHSGNRYPPVVGIDGNLYQTNVHYSDDWIPGGHVSGWRLHTPFLSTPVSRWLAMDEPVAYSSGGNLIYWNHCCDRSAGAADIALPNSTFPREDMSREWWYYSYNIGNLVPGYGVMVDGTFIFNELPDFPGPYGGPNGVYQSHTGEQNPPIPYHGKVYSHRSNALLAFGTPTVEPASLPLVSTVPPVATTPSPVSQEDLTRRLVKEVEKMLAAGHLRPGRGHHGFTDGVFKSHCGDQFSDYWHNPADVHMIMLQTLPHLPAATREQLLAYLKTEFTQYPPFKYTSIGWRDGAARDVFDLPVEEEVLRSSFGPAELSSQGFGGWRPVQEGGPRMPPYVFYAVWKYAAVMGDARTLFEAGRLRLPAPPSDDVLARFPFAHNAYIAGYLGFLELEKLAGYPESENVRKELDRLLALRASTFSKDTPYHGLNPISDDDGYCRALSVSRNFMFLVPELADYLRTNAPEKVREAVAEYERIAPYWFVPFFENGLGENSFVPLYDRLLFLAKAWILREPRETLVKYLDVPAFAVGDLFYIQNLVAALEAPSAASSTGNRTEPGAGSVPRPGTGGGIRRR